MGGNLTPSEIKKTVQVKLANLKVADAVFINSVIAVFCDPNHNVSAECIKSGLAYIAYGQGGKLQVVHRLDAAFTRN